MLDVTRARCLAYAEIKLNSKMELKPKMDPSKKALVVFSLVFFL